MGLYDGFLINLNDLKTIIDLGEPKFKKIGDLYPLKIIICIKVIHWEDYTYAPIVAYASNYVDILLFLHYLACALMYFKSKRALYLLEVIIDQIFRLNCKTLLFQVVRTTDGSHQFYNIGDVSIQEAAAWVLEKYYIDFNLYNPALQKSSKSRLKNMANFKVMIRMFSARCFFFEN